MTKPTTGVDYSLKTAWSRFWFSPTDPSSLGFMRIVIGLIVLYLHFSYILDYRDFFGKSAWFDLESANHYRQDIPLVLGGFSWDKPAKPEEYKAGDPPPSIHFPESPAHRYSVIQFLRALPDKVEDRKYALRFFIPLIQKATDEAPTNAANLAVIEALAMANEIKKLPPDEMQRVFDNLALQGVVNQKEIPVVVPAYLLAASAEDRLEALKQLRDFLAIFDPRPPAILFSYFDIDHVFSWLKDTMPSQRKAFLNYIDSLPENAVEREKILDTVYAWRTDPRNAFRLGGRNFSFWFHVTDPTTMWIVYGLHLVVIVLFTLGWYTRITSVMTWVGMLNIVHRTPFVLYGMDAMMSLLLFYLMIGPSGAALSIDRLRARYRAARAIQKADGKPVAWAEATLAGPVPSRLANCIIRMMQIHFCFMYLSAGFSKLKGTSWWNLTAPWYVMANPEFCPTNIGLYETTLRFLAEHRILLSLVMMGGVFFTLAVEIGVPFLLWTRLRPYAIMMSVTMHLGIDFFMGLSVFSMFMHAWILCFFPAALIREKVGFLTGGMRLKMIWNSREADQAQAAAVIRTLDLTGQVEMAKPKKIDEFATEPLKLVDSKGETHTGDEIPEILFRDLVLLQSVKLLTWIPGTKAILRKIMKV